MKKKLLLILVLLFVFVAEIYSKNELEVLVQPCLTLSENGSWKSKAETKPAIHRAKLSLRLDRDIFKSSKIKSRLSVDFAEKDYVNILKNGYVAFEPLSQLKIKAGKFKVPFGAHNLISSTELKTIYRSYTSDHLRDNLAISGYQYGFTLYGKLHKMLQYEVGIFNYANNQIDGFHIKDIMDFPVLLLKFEPIELIRLSYNIAAPQAGTVLENGKVEYNRFFFHDISLEFNTKNNLYETLFNSFIGVDTTEVDEAQVLMNNYGENIAFSLFSEHTFNIKLKKEFTLSLVTGFEYLNGLNMVDENSYENRNYYFVLSENLLVKYKNKFFIQFAYDTKLNNSFESIHENRFTAQLTYFDRFNLSKKSK